MTRSESGFISGSNSVVEFLPSKQAVAGSSPVSRSLSSLVSLKAHDRPLHIKQAVRGYQGGDLVFGQTAFNEHLPHFAASTCLMLWGNLPLSANKHLPRML
jgi:hypothetical protein